MHTALVPLVEILVYVLDLFKWCIIGSIILSWLIYGNVVNSHNRFVYLVGDTLHKVTDWAIRPIRRIMPDTGAIDLSPMVVILIVWLIQAYLPILLLG